MSNIINNKKYSFLCKYLEMNMLKHKQLTNEDLKQIKNFNDIYICIAMDNDINYHKGILVGRVKLNTNNNFIIFERFYVNLKSSYWRQDIIYDDVNFFKMKEYISRKNIKILTVKDIKIYKLIKKIILSKV